MPRPTPPAAPPSRLVRGVAIGLTWIGLGWAGPTGGRLAAEESAGQEPGANAEAVKHFEGRVRPLLLARCVSCHGEKEQNGSLRLDSAEAFAAGGDSGPLVDPADPAESLLLTAVRHESFEMPPSGKLPERDIEALTTWVEQGAIWPSGDAGTLAEAADGSRVFSDDDKAWWAIRPVADANPPVVPNDTWSRSPIDRFILAKLTEKGLAPAPEADRRTLIRRVTFDLTGLPATPEAIDAFVADERPDAYERLVESLMASPAYGERMARPWLDLVRYAESDGYRQDADRPTAWRYRDYVIDALNADRPYDRFVAEQLAGDELFPDDPTATIATGYLRHGIYEYNSRDVVGHTDLILNEITDTTADVFLGLGLSCARCHDHKYDPLLQRDYFRLRACFESLAWPMDAVAATPAERKAHAAERAAVEAITADLRAELAKLEAPARKKLWLDAVTKFPADVQPLMDKPAADLTVREKQFVALIERQVNFEYEKLDATIAKDVLPKVKDLRQQIAEIEQKFGAPAPLPAALAATDIDVAAPPTVIPGTGVEVGPGVPALLADVYSAQRLADATVFVSREDGHAAPAETLARLTRTAPTSGDGATPGAADDVAALTPLPTAATTGRRAALALWLARPDHPLTARVIVNRMWGWCFGKGLTTSPSDFGRLGELPSHPELLDYLAHRFVEQGWSLKKLQREIVLSATYRQASVHPRERDYLLVDPDNRLRWRADVRRLDAEMVRDALFAVGGRLSTEASGPSVAATKPRRSVYTTIQRNTRDPLLDVFDMPLFFSSQATRDVSTTPLQALLLLNSDIMNGHAAALAKRVVAEPLPSAASPSAGLDEVVARVDRLWRLALGRLPSDAERDAATAYLNRRLPTSGPDGKPPGTAEQTKALADLAQIVLAGNEFFYVP